MAFNKSGRWIPEVIEADKNKNNWLHAWDQGESQKQQDMMNTLFGMPVKISAHIPDNKVVVMPTRETVMSERTLLAMGSDLTTIGVIDLARGYSYELEKLLAGSVLQDERLDDSSDALAYSLYARLNGASDAAVYTQHNYSVSFNRTPEEDIWADEIKNCVI